MTPERIHIAKALMRKYNRGEVYAVDICEDACELLDEALKHIQKVEKKNVKLTGKLIRAGEWI